MNDTPRSPRNPFPPVFALVLAFLLGVLLERQGWLVRRQGLGTFVTNPVRQELGSGVRTITEVLASSGITPHVDVLSHRVDEPPRRIAETLGLSKVLCIHRRFRDGDVPLALMIAYLPPGLGKAVEPLLSSVSDTQPARAMESTSSRLASVRCDC